MQSIVISLRCPAFNLYFSCQQHFVKSCYIKLRNLQVFTYNVSTHLDMTIHVALIHLLTKVFVCLPSSDQDLLFHVYKTLALNIAWKTWVPIYLFIGFMDGNLYDVVSIIVSGEMHYCSRE